jgi:hypothetical protein
MKVQTDLKENEIEINHMKIIDVAIKYQVNKLNN